MKKQSYGSLRAYAKYVATFKWRFFGTLASFILADILLALLPVVVGQFVDALSHVHSDTHQIYFLVGVLIAISVLHDMFWRISELLFRGLLSGKLYEFETLIFKAVVRQPYPYFIDKFTGKIINTYSHITLFN